MIQVLVSSGSPLWLGGLCALLDREPDFAVIGAPLDSALAAEAHHLRPDVVLADIGPALTATIATIAALRKAAPHCAVVLLTDGARHDELKRAVQAGVRGLVSTDTKPTHLVEAIRRAAQGELAIDADLAIAGLRSPPSPLTPRERDVLKASAEGATVAEIAQRLFLTTGTVRNYLSRITLKTGARNRIDAINIATQNGWL